MFCEWTHTLGTVHTCRCIESDAEPLTGSAIPSPPGPWPSPAPRRSPAMPRLRWPVHIAPTHRRARQGVGRKVMFLCLCRWHKCGEDSAWHAVHFALVCGSNTATAPIPQHPAHLLHTLPDNVTFCSFANSRRAWSHATCPQERGRLGNDLLKNTPAPP